MTLYAHDSKSNGNLKPSSVGEGGARNTPFFMIGSGRSGSTLLSRMLNCHPRIAVPGESHLFDVFYRLIPYYGNLAKRPNQQRLVDDILSTYQVQTWEAPPSREEILANIEVPTFAGIMDAMMRSWARAQGKQRWGEKTPHHTFYWREIAECFPDTQFIHLVRDGRDVALSYIKARFGSKTIFAAAKRWVRWMEQIEALKSVADEKSFLEIRYEDLLTDTRNILTKICDFLGETYSNQMLAFHKVDLSANVMDQSNRQNLKKPLLPENAQKWRHSLSEREQRIFEAIAQPVLQRYGYDHVFASRPKLTWHERFFRGAIQNPILKGLAMATNRPGHADEWIRLKIRLRLILLDRFR